MEPTITIRLEGGRVTFAPGETLRGTLSWQHSESPTHAELSVLWLTEGKGDRDYGIAHFEEITLDSRGEHAFETHLPLLPLTYHGELMKIHWTVRVRLDRKWRRDPVFELPFELVAVESGVAAL
jgi:hypothetical protein